MSGLACEYQVCRRRVIGETSRSKTLGRRLLSNKKANSNKLFTQLYNLSFLKGLHVSSHWSGIPFKLKMLYNSKFVSQEFCWSLNSYFVIFSSACENRKKFGKRFQVCKRYFPIWIAFPSKITTSFPGSFLSLELEKGPWERGWQNWCDFFFLVSKEYWIFWVNYQVWFCSHLWPKIIKIATTGTQTLFNRLIFISASVSIS